VIAVLQVVVVAVTEGKGILSKLTVIISPATQVPVTVTVVPTVPVAVLNVIVVPIAACTGAKITMQANNSKD